MADGPLDLNYINETRKKFFRLFEQNKLFPLHLSVRCALRLLPLVAKASISNQKNESINPVKYNLLEIIIILKKSVGVIANQLLSEKYLGDRYQIQIPEQCEIYIRRYLELIQAIYYYSNDAAGDNAQALGYYSSCCVVEFDAAQNDSGIATYSFEEDMQFIVDQDLSALNDLGLWLGKKHSDVIDAYRNELLPLLDKVLIGNDETLKKQLELLKFWYEKHSGFDSIDNFRRDPSEEMAYENDSVIIDTLNRSKLIDALFEKLKYDSNKGHLTVGLLGHWGSGKTRILNLLKDRLIKKDSNFIWGEFNAWAYEHTENIQAGMAHEIIQALTQNPITFDEEKERKSIVDAINNKFSEKNELTVDDHSNWVEWKLHLRQSKYALSNLLVWQLFRKLLIAGGFVARKHPFKMTLFSVITVITVIIGIYVGTGIISDERTPLKDLIAGDAAAFGVFGTFSALLYWISKNIKQVFAQPYTKELLTYVKLPSYSKHLGLVSEMRKDIKLLCKQRLQRGLFKSEKRMVFVVDDLDRCSPDGIVKTLEAVRLILDIENVTVIVAVDQRIALAALAYHYQEIQDFHTSGDARTIARDYLGKIIHLPINIPEPDIETVKGYMGYVWQNDEDDSGELDWRQLVLPEDKAKMEQRDNSDERPKQPSEEQQDLDSGKDTDSEKDSDKKLTVEEVAQLILEEPLPEAVKPKPESILKGLTPEQKAAFVYWTDQFQLTNPRQLKRLHNSYNLLQLVSEKIDKIISDKHHLAFGYLVTLIALEFINNQLDLRLASELKDYLFSCKTDDEDTPIGETPEALKPLNDDNLIGACRNAREVICAAAEVLVSYDSNHNKLSVLFSLVNAFVLPAIEVANAKSVKFKNSEVKT